MTELYVPTTVRTSNPATDSVGHNVREWSECMSKENNSEITSLWTSSFTRNPRVGTAYWATCAVTPTKLARKVTLSTPFPDVPGSKIGRDTEFSGSLFRGYSHFFEVNAGMKPQMR
jgi:hypothetical protein